MNSDFDKLFENKDYYDHKIYSIVNDSSDNRFRMMIEVNNGSETKIFVKDLEKNETFQLSKNDFLVFKFKNNPKTDSISGFSFSSSGNYFLITVEVEMEFNYNNKIHKIEKTIDWKIPDYLSNRYAGFDGTQRFIDDLNEMWDENKKKKLEEENKLSEKEEYDNSAFYFKLRLDDKVFKITDKSIKNSVNNAKEKVKEFYNRIIK